MIRTIISITFAVITAVAALAQSGESIYKKYSDCKGVEGVYISPAMFQMIGSIPDLEIDDADINLSGIIRSLRGLYIVEAKTPEIRKSLKKDVESFVNSKKYELMMEMKSDGERVHIYTVGDQTNVESFVMLSEEDDEVVFISIDGTMPRKELESMIMK